MQSKPPTIRIKIDSDNNLWIYDYDDSLKRYFWFRMIVTSRVATSNDLDDWPEISLTLPPR